MNNIRKIIEERLENARLDFGKTTREFNAELKGQIEAYQDCLNLIPKDLGELSDGYHTFDSLYEQRCILFATIVNQNKNISWKSYKHEDGQLCFGGGWFIVGIDTPEGSYTYHYENKYWDLFKCKELECGKKWDGHTDKDVARLLNITPAPRTEVDILNDFEKFGYEIKQNNSSCLIMINDKTDEIISILKKDTFTISTGYKKYIKDEDYLATFITMQEHKLLNELFICWGWL